MKSNKIFIISVLISTINLSAMEPVADTQEMIPVSWGMYACRGPRSTMEDTCYCKISNDQALFALFDGHGGSAIAEFAAQRLPFFLNRADKNSSLKDRLKYALAQIEAQSLQQFSGQALGTTALIALIEREQAVVGWIGDSRALVMRESALLHETVDHKPSRPKEKARLAAIGDVV